MTTVNNDLTITNINPKESVNPASSASKKNVNSVYDTAPTQETTTQATSKIDELYEKIRKLCDQYHLNYDEIKKSGLLGKIANCTEEELVEDSQKQENIISCLKAALKNCSRKNKNIDLETVIYTASNYHWAINNGISKDRVRKGGESVTERFKRYFGNKIDVNSLEELSEEDQKKYIKDYFTNYFKDLTKKKGYSKETAAKIQKNDFKLLIMNSSPEERSILMDSVTSLMSENALGGFEDILSICRDDKERSNIVNNSVKAGLAEDVIDTICPDGKKISKEDANKILDQIGKYVNADNANIVNRKFAGRVKEFYNAHKDEIDAIYKKIDAKEELSQEDENLLLQLEEQNEHIESFNKGVLKNEIMTKEEKTDVITTLETEIKDLPFSDDIKQSLVDYVEQHPEEVKNYTVDDINKVLNNVDNSAKSNTTNNETTQGGLGHSYDPNFDKQAAQESLVFKRNQLYSPQSEVIPEEVKSQEETQVEPEQTKEKSLNEVLGSSLTELKTYLKNKGLSFSQAIIEAGKKFSELTSSVQDAVIGYVKILQENDRLNLVKQTNSTSFAVEIAKKIGVKDEQLDRELSWLPGDIKKEIRRYNESQKGVTTVNS